MRFSQFFNHAAAFFVLSGMERWDGVPMELDGLGGLRGLIRGLMGEAWWLMALFCCLIMMFYVDIHFLAIFGVFWDC